MYILFRYTAFRPPVWFLCVTSFNHWLLIVNASFNFLIYCSVGTNFKEVIVASSKCCVKVFGNSTAAGGGLGANGDATSLSDAPTSRLRTKRLEEGRLDLHSVQAVELTHEPLVHLGDIHL